jgi:hypothetical protein
MLSRPWRPPQNDEVATGRESMPPSPALSFWGGSYLVHLAVEEELKKPLHGLLTRPEPRHKGGIEVAADWRKRPWIRRGNTR